MKAGKTLHDILQKASPLPLSAALRIKSYKDKQGNSRSSTEVVVDRWEFVPADNASNSIGDVNSGEDFQEVGGLDDLPF